VAAVEWITPEEVAAYLDLPGAPDDNLTLSTAAVKAAVEGRRSDLWLGGDPTATPPVPAVFTPGDDVHTGSIIWAALVYQARGRLASANEFFEPLGTPRPDVMRLIGWRRPELA